MVAAHKMAKFTGRTSSELDHSHWTSRKQAWSTRELQLVGNTLLINDVAAKPAREALSSYNVLPTLSTEVSSNCIHLKNSLKESHPFSQCPTKFIQKPKSTERHYEGKDTKTKEN